ncbi:MAG: hypothetical protein KDA94_06345, partial [Acidimicrobiales bacterium]|nr:hypothetical protein [Acidimicrobiales bacterium]
MSDSNPLDPTRADAVPPAEVPAAAEVPPAVAPTEPTPVVGAEPEAAGAAPPAPPVPPSSVEADGSAPKKDRSNTWIPVAVVAAAMVISGAVGYG